MTELGKKLRLGRIFDRRSETALVIAMDHGVVGYFEEMEDPRPVIAAIADAGANAFLMNSGLAKFAASELSGRAGLVLRVSCCTSFNDDATDQMVISTVEDALRLGADAVAPNFFFGTRNEPRDLRFWGQLAAACDKWGMPLFPEVHPPAAAGAVPYDGPYTVDEMRRCVRIAGEIGADLIKTWYSGDPQGYSQVVRNSLVPIAIAGGPKVDTARQVLEMVRGAVDAGVRGVCIGRNIWGYHDPGAMTRAVARILREDSGVEGAMSELRQ